MLAQYRSDQPAYQPTHNVPLLPEDGNPQASLENLKRLNLPIEHIWVCKRLSRVLFQFVTGEQYLALGLSDPETLARVAADAGMGDYESIKSECVFLAGGGGGEDFDNHRMPFDVPWPSANPPETSHPAAARLRLRNIYPQPHKARRNATKRRA